MVKLKLSDAFVENGIPGEFEWTATMININSGKNEDLKNACKVLSEYCIFVELVREYNVEIGLENAILKAIDKCIKDNVLRDILEEYRWERKQYE